ncbi:MAG: hypothetical protein ABI614_00625 [Planctomycetota bacterium]
MNHITTSAEDSISASRGKASSSLLRHSIVWLGIPLTCTLAPLDAQALQLASGRSTGWLVYGVYALFVFRSSGNRIQRRAVS